MSDLETFFKEQQERMDMPDEDFNEYLARIGGRKGSVGSETNPYVELYPAPAPAQAMANEAGSKLMANEAIAAHNGRAGPVTDRGTPPRANDSTKRNSPATRAETPQRVAKKRKISGHEEMSEKGVSVGHNDRATRMSHVGQTLWVSCNNSNRNTQASGQYTSRRLSQVRDSTRRRACAEDSIDNEHLASTYQKPSADDSGIETRLGQHENDNSAVADGCIENLQADAQGHDRHSEAPRIASEDRSKTPLPQLSSSPPVAEASARTKVSRHAVVTTSHGRGRVLKLPKKDLPEISGSDMSHVVSTPGNTAQVSVPGSNAAAKDPSSTISTKARKQQTASGVARKERSKKKEKVLMTPLEYAQKLQARILDAQNKGKSSSRAYLKGKRIYYFGGDMQYAGTDTRGKMDFIVKHGGVLVPLYDPAQITHIVTVPHRGPLLRALGLRELSGIPDHIPTVKWSWVLSGLSRDRGCRAQTKATAAGASRGGNGEKIESDDDDDDSGGVMDYELMHAAFKERLDAGPSPWTKMARQKQRQPQASTSRVNAGDSGISRECQDWAQGQDNFELSAISEYTEDRIDPKASVILEYNSTLPSPPSSPRTSRRSPTNAGGHSSAEPHASHKDPPASTRAQHNPAKVPAEFHAGTRAERGVETRLKGGQVPGEVSSDEGEPPQNDVRALNRGAVQKRGFLCDQKRTGEDVNCVNQDVSEKLEELMEVHRARLSEEDRWRVYSYQKAIRALRSHPERIQSYDQARALKGIGDKTAQKIIEILETGRLQRLEYEKSGDVGVIQMFQGIYGVGQHIAYQWYANGCRTLDDVRVRKGGIKLSTVQEIGLEHYGDINSRMPRSEAADIFNIIKPIALNIDPQLVIEIMGSYRRGKADCGDIDILITRPTDDGKTHEGVLWKLLRELHRRDILTEDLSLPDSFEDLELVYRGLCRKDSTGRRRRIDFLTVPYKSRGAALLYYTGDDIFNRSLRLKANTMGYSLNQRGLFAGVIRNPSDKREKLNDGIIIASETEEEILRLLKVPWQEPHERARH